MELIKGIRQQSFTLKDTLLTSEKLQGILKSHKTGITFYTERILRKLPCKPKGRELKKIKKISFMKLTEVTAKQSSSVNLNNI